VLTASNLQKKYKKRLVVNDISLNVARGEIVGLLGPNGAGKTTCFYMIVGLIDQNSGRVCIDKEDISKLPIHGRANKGIGYLPQEPSIFKNLNVEQNILAILETKKSIAKKQRYTILEELLDEFNITHIRKSLGISLSGGERRRVEIARAIASDPKFILLDEPFAGVDPISVNDIKNVIYQLKQKNIGILITDHNVRETLDICERAYIIGEGKVIAEGTSKQILQNKRVQEVYLGDNFRI
jgi:lipopolysaccharide export system ATP-binding protein